MTVLALLALFPPGGLALATGGVITAGITTEAAAALGLSGVLLMTAGANGRQTAEGPSGSSSRTSRHDHEVAEDLIDRLQNALNTKRTG